MTRTGTAATGSAQKPKPSGALQAELAAVPVRVVDFSAYGLRPVTGGYQLCRVDIAGETCSVHVLRQPEPQLAVATAYLEAAVAESYLETRR